MQSCLGHATSIKKTITKNLKESRDGVPKSIQTRVGRMGNKGQGSSLLIYVLSLRLFICQALKIVILISLLMVTKK